MAANLAILNSNISDTSVLDVSIALMFTFNYVGVILSETLSVIGVIGVILCETLSVIGVIFNILNVVVFSRMGFTDTTSISLTFLSIADIGLLMAMVSYRVLFHPYMLEAVDGDLVDAVNYIALGWPHVCFTRISGCLRAFVALERFVCIALPIRVKTLITPRRTFLACSCISATMIAGTYPAFFSYRIGMRYNLVRNKTTVGLIPSTQSYVLENISLSVNTIAQMASFAAVTGLTVATIRTLVRKSQWRKYTSSSAMNVNMSSRDGKMVVLISTVFIGFTFPPVVGSVAMLVSKDYNVNGRYKNLFLATFVIFFHLESLNSSVNFIIYMYMSSKFREVFLLSFHLLAYKNIKASL